MNNTNRALNRLFILVVGIVTLAAGGIIAAVGLVPDARSMWSDIAPTGSDAVSGLFAATPLGETGFSWIWIAVAAALVVLIVLLLVFVFRQGHGHTGTLVTDAPTDHGTTIVDSRLAEQAIQESLSGRAEFVASHVSTYSVRGTAMLKVSATARRGVSPRDITTIVDEALVSLDRLLGVEIPALVHISGGFRARTGRATRLQ